MEQNVQDLLIDSPSHIVAFTNATCLAGVLKYPGGPESTPVKRVLIFCESSCRQFTIREGRYTLAVFAHFCCYRKQQQFGTRNVALITDELIEFMERFMGEHIMEGARERTRIDQECEFARAILLASDGHITIAM